MPNSEELIAMRNEAIKQQEWCLETIEKYIKENSITYYNDYINKSLSTDAKAHTLFDIAVTFNDVKDYIKHLSVSNELLRWAKEITDGKINPNLLFKYANLRDDQENQVIAVRALDCDEENPHYTFIRPSYIKELAEKDNLVFEVADYDGVDNEEKVYTVSATVPKIDLDKQKVLSIKD